MDQTPDTNSTNIKTSWLAANAAATVLKVQPPSSTPEIILSPGDDIISISNDGELVVSLKQDGTVTWPNVPNPDVAGKAFGEALRNSVQHIAGIDSTAKRIIEEDLVIFLMGVADQEGPLSAEGLKIAFEHIRAMNRLRGK